MSFFPNYNQILDYLKELPPGINLNCVEGKGLVSIRNEKNELVFTIAYKGEIDQPIFFINVVLFKYAEIANNLGKKIKAMVTMNGRKIGNYHPIARVPGIEKLLQRKKPEEGFEISDVPQKILERVKLRFGTEIPEMVSGIKDLYGKNLPKELEKDLERIVSATATTASMITIRIILSMFDELHKKGDSNGLDGVQKPTENSTGA